MKMIKLLVLAAVLAVFTFSAAAQKEKESDKSAKDKKTASSKKSADKADRKYEVGARGGCYYLTESGKKNYVDKKYCEGVTAPASDSKTPDAAPAPAEADSKTNTPATDTEKTENKPNSDAPPANAAENSDPSPSDTNGSSKKPAPAANTTGNKKSEKDGRTYILGPKGGCYYLTESGKKVYVKDKSLCAN